MCALGTAVAGLAGFPARSAGPSRDSGRAAVLLLAAGGRSPFGFPSVKRQGLLVSEAANHRMIGEATPRKEVIGWAEPYQTH